MLTLFPANSINLCCGDIDGRRIEQLRPKPNGAIIGEMKDFVHPRLDEPVAAIGGRYVFTAEGQLPVDGRTLLYLAGWAVADATCCGAGGCAYALVPGWIEALRYRTSPDGRAVSRVAPIGAPAVRQRLSRLLIEKTGVAQVVFL